MSTEANFQYLKEIAEAAVKLSAYIEVYTTGARQAGVEPPAELLRRHDTLKRAINPDLPEMYSSLVAARTEEGRES